MIKTLLFLVLINVSAVLQAQVFVHSLAEADGDAVLKYWMNEDKEVQPAEMTYVYRRTATLGGKAGVYDVTDRDAKGVVRMKATMLQPDPISTSYVGERVEFFASADTSLFVKYFEGADRIEKKYHENGQLASFGKYGPKGMSGVWVSYYDNGFKRDSGSYHNGKKVGVWISFHQNGELRSRSSFAEGVETGESAIYYDDASLRESVVYVDGKKAGAFKSFFKDGAAALEGEYLQGERQGTWTEYHRSGQLLKSSHFEDGTLNGPYLYRNDQGDTLISGMVEDGLFTGFTRAYHSDNKLASELVFQRSTVVKRISWYPNGKVKVQAKGSPKGLSGQCYDVLGNEIECLIELERTPSGQQGLSAQLAEILDLNLLDNYMAYGVYGFDVNPEGSVDKVEVVESANPEYDALVLKKLKTLRWDPGVFDGEAVTYSNQVSLRTSASKVVEVRFGSFFLADSTVLQQGYLVDPLLMERSKSPQYQNGEAALRNYLSQSVQFPDEAKDAGIEGICYTEYIVEPSGLISSAAMLRGVHPLLDYESIRVVNEMQPWEAGVQEGQKVKVYYKLPIRFTLR